MRFEEKEWKDALRQVTAPEIYNSSSDVGKTVGLFKITGMNHYAFSGTGTGVTTVTLDTDGRESKKLTAYTLARYTSSGGTGDYRAAIGLTSIAPMEQFSTTLKYDNIKVRNDTANYIYKVVGTTVSVLDYAGNSQLSFGFRNVGAWGSGDTDFGHNAIALQVYKINDTQAIFKSAQCHYNQQDIYRFTVNSYQTTLTVGKGFYIGLGSSTWSRNTSGGGLPPQECDLISKNVSSF